MNIYNGLSLCFDLDGTLVHTAPDLVRVLNSVIAEEGLAETNYSIASGQVGRGAKYLIAQAYMRAEIEITPDRLDAQWELFLKRYEETISVLSEPFPDVPDVLARFKRSGARLSVCTNKPGYLARPLLDALKLSHYFDRIIGSGDGIPAKPNADHIYAACGHKVADQIIMIGDSITDVLAARQAGVPVIVMSYGYSETPTPQLRADRVLRKFRDLPETIRDVRIKRLTRSFQTQ